MPNEPITAVNSCSSKKQSGLSAACMAVYVSSTRGYEMQWMRLSAKSRERNVEKKDIYQEKRETD